MTFGRRAGPGPRSRAKQGVSVSKGVHLVAERSSTRRPSALTGIWIGMPVIDANGTLVGTVKYVKPAAPAAAPIGPASPDDELDTAFARALTEIEPQVGADLGGRLVQEGFLKVTGAGLMDNDCYVLAGQIAVADDDSVHLSASVEDLTVEQERWT